MRVSGCAGRSASGEHVLMLDVLCCTLLYGVPIKAPRCEQWLFKECGVFKQALWELKRTFYTVHENS